MLNLKSIRRPDESRGPFLKRHDGYRLAPAWMEGSGARPVFFVYLLSNNPLGTLYVGSTNDLLRRIWEHKNKVVPGFTNRYGVDRLIWYEAHESLESARLRERQIKEWKRAWKVELIERDNPHWFDLYPSLTP